MPAGSQSEGAELVTPISTLGVILTLGNSGQAGEERDLGSRYRPVVQSVLGSISARDMDRRCPSR